MIRIIITATLLLLAITLPAHAGEIALSFDDAPRGASEYMSGPERTEILIKKLDSLDIDTVVFFIKTDMLPFHKGRMRLDMYARAGHLLANHTHSHKHPYDLGAEAYIEDIRVADSILADLPNSIKWFRFPFLDEGTTISLRDSIRAGLDELGYKNGYVTIDNYEWYLDYLFRLAVKDNKKIDMEKLGKLYVDMLWDVISYYDSVAVAALGRSPKHVLLLHENDLAALFIDKLVAKIRAEGWTIISPAEAYTDSISSYTTNILMNHQGRTMAIARELGHPPPWCHKTEDEAYIDKLVAEQNIFRDQD